MTAKAHFDPSVPVEQGVPISMSATGVFDNAFTAHAVIAAKLTDEAWHDWQLRSWTALRDAYTNRQDEIERREREQEIKESFGIDKAERPASVNRRSERAELKKWAIKAMRFETFDFHPMVTEEGLQEVDPTGRPHPSADHSLLRTVLRVGADDLLLLPLLLGASGHLGTATTTTVG